MIALIIGMLVSLIVTLVGTPLLIRLVHKLHYGQYIRQDGPQSHLVKRGTPTLGGVVINFAILLGWASSALYRYLRSGDVPSWSAALVLFAMLSMGLLGFIDDFAKVRKKQNEGLSVGGKFIGQFIFATIYAVLALLIPTKSGFPSAQIQQVIVCDSMEEAVKDSDIICVTSTAPVKEIDFPYIAEDWVKKGALICLPSAARFDDDFLINRCKKVVDNYKLYEAWAEEFPYPSYEMVQIIGSKFTDYLHEGRIQREDIVDIADIINKKHPGRESDDEIIVYSVGGMPVEDIAWGGTVYRNALKEGIGVELPLWDQPDMA